MTDDNTSTDLSRRALLRATTAAGVLGTGVAMGRLGGENNHDTPAQLADPNEPRAYEEFTVHRVPEAYATIQDAVDAASPRDLVLVGPGRYHEEVTVSETQRLTIRGTDRNEVMLDGEGTRHNGITVTVDGVVIENLTVMNYTYNGVYWTGVDGYRGSHVTAANNGEYGIYAFDSVNGLFEHSYAAGHPDSGFYIGQCNPCHARIEQVTAERNGLGYSGTNAGGDLVIRDSVWKRNMGGIVPNTLDSEKLAPQAATRIENNEVHSNNNLNAPAKAFAYAAYGIGIGIAGGHDNEVHNNTVSNHANYGIAAIPMFDATIWQPAGNLIEGNRVEESGRTDLALGSPNDGGNRFENNSVSSTRPSWLDSDGVLASVFGSTGDPWVTLSQGLLYLQTELGAFPHGDWLGGPDPPKQPSMDDPERPPREAVGPRRDQ